MGWIFNEEKVKFIFHYCHADNIRCACGSDKEAEEATTGAATNDTDAAEETKEITITHQLGETPVKVNPEKVVVFDFGILDSLDKLGVEVTGVPQANIPPYLSKYEDGKYENVGGLKEPDFEKLLRLLQI